MKKIAKLALGLFMMINFISVPSLATNPIEEKRKEFKKQIQKQKQAAKQHKHKKSPDTADNPIQKAADDNSQADAMPKPNNGTPKKTKTAPAVPTGGGNSMDESAAAAVSVH